jgi:hypothetical protein
MAVEIKPCGAGATTVGTHEQLDRIRREGEKAAHPLAGRREVCPACCGSGRGVDVDQTDYTCRACGGFQPSVVVVGTD